LDRKSINHPALFRPCEYTSEQVDEQEQCCSFSVTVLFTTLAATLTALQYAGALAQELGAEIRVLVPHIVPFPLPLDRPQVDPDFKTRHFRNISVDGAVHTYIDVRLCRDRDEAVTQALDSQSVVIIGGRKHWWRTREQRLANTLTLAGHHVIFVLQDWTTGYELRPKTQNINPSSARPRV